LAPTRARWTPVTNGLVSSNLSKYLRPSSAAHEWIIADMRGVALSQRFDGIPAWDRLFHLDHDGPRQMLPVFEHHGSGGAVLMFNTGPAHGETIGQYRGDPLYHASLAPSEYDALLRRFGFEVIQHSANDHRAGGRTVWFCQCRESR
jgi:hypothetical protein